MNNQVELSRMILKEIIDSRVDMPTVIQILASTIEDLSKDGSVGVLLFNTKTGDPIMLNDLHNTPELIASIAEKLPLIAEFEEHTEVFIADRDDL